MRTTFAITCFAVLSCASALFASEPQGPDSLTGFRDIPWQDSREKHPDITGAYEGYHLPGKRSGDPGKWFDLPLWAAPKDRPSFVYHFDRDYGFYGANSLLASGISEAPLKECVNQMVAMLGVPTEKKISEDGGAEYFWRGSKVEVHFWYSGDRSKMVSGSIAINYLPTKAKVEERNSRKTGSKF